MADGRDSGRRRGWMAPQGGGYTFAPRRSQRSRSQAPTPPSGSAGVGNGNRRDDEHRSED